MSNGGWRKLVSEGLSAVNFYGRCVFFQAHLIHQELLKGYENVEYDPSLRLPWDCSRVLGHPGRAPWIPDPRIPKP